MISSLPSPGAGSRSARVGAAMMPGSVSFSESRCGGIGERRVRAHREARAPRAVRLEHVDASLGGGDHDLDAAVAVEVVGGDRTHDRLVRQRDLSRGEAGRSLDREQVRVDREARQLRERRCRRKACTAPSEPASTMSSAPSPSRSASTGGLSAERAESERREAQRRVAVDRHGAPVLADVAPRVLHDEAQGHGVVVGVLDRRRRIEAAASSPSGAGFQRGEHRAGEGLLRLALLEQPELARVHPAADLEAPAEAPRRAHRRRGAGDVELLGALRVHGVEPAQAPGEVGLGRDRLLRDVEEPRRVGAPVAGELVPARRRREALRAEEEAEVRRRQ